MKLEITLIIAAAAALLNIWLAVRVGRVRTSEKVSVGDGGNEAVIRRMRAHANFVEYTPFFLILLGLVELAWGSNIWLWGAAIIYILGRIAHGFGMDGIGKLRAFGTISTLLVLLGLAIYALVIAYSGTSFVGMETVPTSSAG
ncbi:MAPEG family protein [Parasphingopyxis sp. CP4]|uniref:MAPEG family protein n=1 Tax=Parasphingopyxis sp. CP4 TaxID=2724527 RepID=UPI0015A32169|nr:MAPEG family protein [Parasphingopyxis sp. CP4]QLC22341.1 MAPEG family protein [Parasphingopyxis sp. CP4]